MQKGKGRRTPPNHMEIAGDREMISPYGRPWRVVDGMEPVAGQKEGGRGQRDKLGAGGE
jgi:hypothetical protein